MLFAHCALLGKRVRTRRVRQARLRVAVRRGKRAERTHAVLIESNANDKREAKPNEKMRLPELKQECNPV
ncbi:MAG: hypothetical protein COB24_04570 [Hyphomicrobiales bacterium]|nr:MAG: hypothetical protein COB24_04570 [Hyphomicrobiales bacterium]